MADDPTNRGRPDRDRINLNEEYEVQDWAKRFGVTEDELREVVHAVGDRVEAIREHLGKVN